MDESMDWSFCPTNGAMCGPAGGGTDCDGTTEGAAGTIDGLFVNRPSPAWGMAVLRAAAVAAAAASAAFCASICARAFSAAEGESPATAAAPVESDGDADGEDNLCAMAAKFLPFGLPPDPPAEAAAVDGDPAGGVLGPAASAAAAAAVGLFLPSGGVVTSCCFAWSG